MKPWISLLAVLAIPAATLLPGCMIAVDHDHDYYSDDAVFTVEWSIDGSRRPHACLDYGAEYAYVTVESRYGEQDDRTIACDRFGYDFYLPPGRYWVTVTLLDHFQHDVTSTIETDEYTLVAGGGDYVVADFPPDSFR